MKTYAFHYKTGEVMPQELMDKIQKAGTFNQGFAMTELLSASLLDMDYHSLKDTANFDVEAFEKASLERIGMIPQIIVRYRSTFSIIFSPVDIRPDITVIPGPRCSMPMHIRLLLKRAIFITKMLQLLSAKMCSKKEIRTNL